MKKNSKIAVNALLLGVLCGATSCLGTDDETNIVLYDDVAITQVTFGTLTNGSKTYSGASYPLRIDQKSRTIYNDADSLPMGTRLDKVLLNVATKNSALPLMVTDNGYKSMTSTDTLDLSKEREIHVYSSSLAKRATYKIKVVAHAEEADSFTWAPLCSEEKLIEHMSNVHCAATANRMYAIGKVSEVNDNNEVTVTTDLVSTELNDGRSWRLDHSFSQAAQIISDGTTLYVLDGPADARVLYVSNDDAANWTTYTSDNISAMASLAAAADGRVYAITNDNRIMESADKGATWTTSPLKGNTAMLPLNNISYTIETLSTNKEMRRVAIIGTRSVAEHESDVRAVIWSRMYDTTSDYAEEWIEQPYGDGNTYALPRLSGLSAVSYGDYMLAFGGDGEGACKVYGYQQIYASVDHGLTWKKSSIFKLPKGFATGVSSATMITDSSNTLWIICGGTGQVWRGRQHKLTWNTFQKEFK